MIDDRSDGMFTVRQLHTNGNQRRASGSLCGDTVSIIMTLAAHSKKRNVSITTRPGVRPSVCLVGILTVTHLGLHATRPAYIWVQQ